MRAPAPPDPAPRRPRHWRGTLLLAAALLGAAAPGAAREVRVGLYDNPPKLLAAADGQPSGIFGDLLQEIARREGWTLQPVPCAWEACLQALERGEIDLMPDVARNEARERRFDFHQEPALHSWSQLYRREGVAIQSMLDLEGKRVVVLAGSVQETHLAALLAGFGLNATLVPVASFEAGFAEVAAGRADAVVANHHFGSTAAPRHHLQDTSLVFLPSALYFATGKGRGADLREAIDRRLGPWRASPGSPYFEALARWGGRPAEPQRLPPALWWGLGGLAALLLAALAGMGWLRREVARRTRALADSEARVAAAHALLEDAIECAPAGIAVFDADDRLRSFNSRLRQMSSGDPAAVKPGMAFADFVRAVRGDRVAFPAHDADERWLAERLRHHRAPGPPLEVQLQGGRWLQIGETRTRHGGTVIVYTDITGLKQREGELQRSADELEAQVAARTEALRRSEARLRQVNQELETFTYSVSHDLKAPLRGIDGYSRLLITDHRDRLDDEGRTFLDQIRGATQHMGALIDDLLAYSRLERRDLTLQRLALAPLVSGVLAGFEAECAERGVLCTVDVPADLHARADAQGLTMALRNLVDNALKFSRDSQPPRLSLRAWADTADSGRPQVHLAVSDNGVGFEMKFVERIFTIFQRLHRAEEFPGTGVGLAIVRKAMDRMGGAVRAESTPGQGATFTLTLPADG